MKVSNIILRITKTGTSIQLMASQDQSDTTSQSQRQDIPKQNPFKPPRKILPTIVSSESSSFESISVDDDETEEAGGDAMDVEGALKESAREWLDLHGSKLFSLEASKFLARTKSTKPPPRS